MLNIRRNLFETNSSSTHSISLAKPTPEKRLDIPHNELIQLEPYEEPAPHYNDETAEFFAYCTQVAKLRYLVHIIVSILYEDVPDIYLTEFRDKLDDWQYKPTKEEKEQFANEFFSQSQFKWLCEMIYEKTGSTLSIRYDLENEFPFWETIYDDNESLLRIFNFDYNSWNNETEFKSKMSKYIFDDSVIIYDKNIPYRCDFTETKEF